VLLALLIDNDLKPRDLRLAADLVNALDQLALHAGFR
jgi:hypothetical protein